ncbi:MAG: alpha/beta fold hydrolase [Pseudomonadota bacterium]|nr:alpha/beta fold hydrolase [Pseudomonadota bacterium]
MNPRTVRESVAGPAGRIECALDRPESPPIGVAVICHPHPQGGGTLDNKVVQTLARAFMEVGWASLRFNFRGVGASEGAWDEGRGELDDALAIVHDARRRAEFAALPLALAGFSFGGYIAAAAAARLGDGDKPRRLVLVAPSTEKQQVPAVPPDSIVIHGDIDELVPLESTLAWARPLALPVIVFPGVGHFFHGQLGLLKSVVLRELRGRDAV